MFEAKNENKQQPKEVTPVGQTPKVVRTGKMPEKIIRANNKKTSGFITFAENFIRLYRIIMVLFVVLLLVGAGGGGYWLYQTNILDIKGSLDQKMKVLDEKEQELSSLKSVKVSYDDLEDSAQRILDVLPDKKDLPSLFVQLEALVYKNNLFLEAVDVAEADQLNEKLAKIKKQTLHKLAITLNLSGGDYFTLKNLLVDIEKNLRLLDIKSLVFSPDSQTYNLTVNTYYFGERYVQTDSE